MGPDTESFEAWYRPAFPRLAAAMTAVARDAEVGREVAAEACARAYARWGDVGAMDAPDGWVYRVALNELRRRARRAALERRLLARAPRSEPAPPPGLEFEVWDAVAGLPARVRVPIALRYLAGMTQREIAGVLGVSPGTVASRLHAGRTRLGELLDVSDDRDPARSQEAPRG